MNTVRMPGAAAACINLAVASCSKRYSYLPKTDKEYDEFKADSWIENAVRLAYLRGLLDAGGITFTELTEAATFVSKGGNL